MPRFIEMLQAKWNEGKFVCVGLDSDYSKIPLERLGFTNAADALYEKVLFAFNRMIVDATKGLVCAYKPNKAYYESYGAHGEVALQETCDYIRQEAPDVPIILDYKRGDIDSTNNGYVSSAFQWLNVDAVTVHPYLGMEAMKPFLDCADRGIIVLCRTSNPGAGELQDLETSSSLETLGEGLPPVPDWLTALAPNVSIPMYRRVAHQVKYRWNYNGNCAVVAGATYPEELEQIRWIVGDMPILIPGIGAQGGDLEATVRAGANSRKQGMIINSSRRIIFADDPRAETLKMHEAINAVLAAL